MKVQKSQIIVYNLLRAQKYRHPRHHPYIVLHNDRLRFD
jgi:hypothetical protein